MKTRKWFVPALATLVLSCSDGSVLDPNGRPIRPQHSAMTAGITAVEFFNPATGQFVDALDGTPDTITVGAGTTLLVRVSAITDAAEPVWESTKILTSYVPIVCDDDIAVTNAGAAGVDTVAHPTPAVGGEYSFNISARPEDACGGPAIDGAAVSVFINVVDQARITGAEILNPSTGQFVGVLDTTPDTIAVGAGTTLLMRVAATTDSAETTWQSTRVSSAYLGFLCDNDIAVTNAGTAAVDTVAVPAPAIGGDYSFLISARIQDTCNSPQLDDVAASVFIDVIDQAEIAGVEIFNPSTGQFVNVLDATLDTITVDAGTTLLLRVAATTDSAETTWQSTRVSSAYLGFLCDNDIAVTNAGTAAVDTVALPAPASGGDYSFLISARTQDTCNSPELGDAAASVFINVIDQARITGAEILNPSTGQFIDMLDAMPDTITVNVGTALLLRVSATTDSAETTWQATRVITSFNAIVCDLDIAVSNAGTSAQDSVAVPAPAVSGEYIFRISARVEDTCNSPQLDDVAPLVFINVSVPNTAPDLTPIGNQSVNELATLAFTAVATDAQSDPITFSLASPATGTFPAGATITNSGAFSWTPNENQGPGVYRVKIVASDGTLSSEEEIQITVAEVNVPPVLTVPASFNATWGNALPATSATATDGDQPANTLTFSLVTFPTGMTINASNGAISWTPAASQVGANLVRVRVGDNGTPSAGDEEEFTITVVDRVTSLTYDGATTGQYSDKAWLSATLRDATTNAPISGQNISFTFNGAAAGSAVTDADGRARVLYQVLVVGTPAVTAASAAANGYAAANANASFTVTKENAIVLLGSANVAAIPISQTSYAITVGVKEAFAELDPNPDPDGRAAPGFISNAALSARLVGITTPNNYTVNNCTATGVSGTQPGYAAVRNFTCTFTGPFAVDAYTIELTVNGSHYTGSTDDAMTVYDPAAGGVTGGGTFQLGGDRVSFGISFTMTKGKTTPRGGLVIIRHHSDGSRCRLKSNQLDAPAVNGTTAAYTGRGNYTCVNALGVTTSSAGNQTILGYLEDNATPGANADEFWIRAYGELFMQNTPSAAANTVLLTGGNIQVARP